MSIVFQHAVEEYLKYSKTIYKKSNYYEQNRKIMKHILPYFKDKDIYKIGIGDIVSWKISIEKYDRLKDVTLN